MIVDAGMPFVQATYRLEGNGPLALLCYEVISSLTMAVNLHDAYATLSQLAGSSKMSIWR